MHYFKLTSDIEMDTFQVEEQTRNFITFPGPGILKNPREIIANISR
jgi:hypothetical protein